MRVIKLDDVGPMVSSFRPLDRGEAGTYNRIDSVAVFHDRQVMWTWKIADGQVPTTLPRMRLMIDGSPATDWLSGTAGGYYTFDVTLPEGHHVAYVVAESTSVRCFAAPFLVPGAARLPDDQQTPWSATMRFESSTGNYAMQFRYAANNLPVAAPMKPRDVQHLKGAAMPGKQLYWVRHQVTSTTSSIQRAWCALPPHGDIGIERRQQYFYSSAVFRDTAVAPGVPRIAMIDGPRYSGAFGFVSDMRLTAPRGGAAPNGAFYFLETSGRFGVCRPDGSTETFAGWRVKPGQFKYHSDIENYKYWYHDRPALGRAYEEKYNAAWENVGDWSRVAGLKHFNEPWCFALAERRDGKTFVRGGHEMWIGDTHPQGNRILYLNHFTAHKADAYEKAHFPPPGYVPPAEPTGQTTIIDFLVGPSDQVNEPWGVRVSPHDGKLYWSNYGNNSIWRCNLDRSGVELVMRSSVHPSDADLGIRQRLMVSIYEPATIRAQFLRDGPIGTASLIKPQYIAFTSNPDELLVAERYTYAIRRINLRTREVTTVCAVLDKNGGSDSSGNNDIMLTVDDEGSVGPIDDIFAWCWSGASDKRYSRDGVARSRWLYTGVLPMQNGPQYYTAQADYGWGADVYGGRIIASGNAGGSQFVEITARLPSDPEPDTERWKRGAIAYYNAGLPLSLGSCGGQGSLGLPTCDEMASWDDAKLASYLEGSGVPATQVSDCAYYLRWQAIDYVTANSSALAVASNRSGPRFEPGADDVCSASDASAARRLRVREPAGAAPSPAASRSAGLTPDPAAHPAA